MNATVLFCGPNGRPWWWTNRNIRLLLSQPPPVTAGTRQKKKRTHKWGSVTPEFRGCFLVNSLNTKPILTCYQCTTWYLCVFFISRYLKAPARSSVGRLASVRMAMLWLCTKSGKRPRRPWRGAKTVFDQPCDTATEGSLSAKDLWTPNRFAAK